VAALRAQAGPPPSSLDQYYPPQSEAPVYMLKMQELAGLMGGMFLDLQEGDVDNVSGEFAAFKTSYAEAADMVPEWKALFPNDVVDALGAALQSGEQEGVMAAAMSVGAVCHDCHVANMVKVQQKYHWPEFLSATATDPVTDQEFVITDYMQNMEMAFTGVFTSLQQGQVDRARNYYEQFSSRFVGLANLCMNCHDTERTYFIDESVQRLVRGMGTALESNPPDADRVMELAQRIGEEACMRCHMVHLPAALAQLRFAAAH
jgi:hypothetical protein